MTVMLICLCISLILVAKTMDIKNYENDNDIDEALPDDEDTVTDENTEPETELHEQQEKKIS